MTDEVNLLDPIAPATPTSEEPSTQPDTGLDNPAPAEGELQPIIEDLEDFEWEGKQVKLPKGMKEGFLRQSDYTKKTQATAAKAKELEQREQRLAQQATAHEEELDLRANQRAIRKELEEYSKLDWSALRQHDRTAATEHELRVMALQNADKEISGELSNRENARAEETKQETANRLRETWDYAKTKIPGWSPEVDAKMTELATRELGIPKETLLAAYNPQIYRALHLALIGHQTLTGKTAASAPPSLQQTQTVGSRGNPNPNKSLADMTMEEYNAYRDKQEAAKRR